MKYEKPEVKMFKFEVEDVITTSAIAPTTTIPQVPTTKEDYGWEGEIF